jgi:uncharacterized protein (TIGR02246 family)
MSATTPEALHGQWRDLFNAADLDGLMSLYEPAAILVPEPGKTVKGLEGIRAALGGFLALQATFAFQFQAALETDGLALVFSRWTLSGQSPEGEIALSGQTSDVARRQADGRWLFLIDNPFGARGVENP